MKDEDCGLINMFRLQKKVESSFDYSMSDFHAFNACELMGHGWYLPAINERLLIPRVLGLELAPNAKNKEKRDVSNAVNNFLKENGIRPHTTMRIYSSTEIGKGKVWTINWRLSKEQGYKSLCSGRAIMPVHLVKAVEGKTSAKP